jgi:CHASE domain
MRFPGIDALAWVPQMSAQEHDATEVDPHSDGHPGLTFGGRNKTGGGGNASIFPVRYLEPPDADLLFLGDDLDDRRSLETLMAAAAWTGLSPHRACGVIAGPRPDSPSSPRFPST